MVLLKRAHPYTQLVSHGLSSFKVMDICCMTNCAKTASTTERLKALRAIMAKDDTHFLGDGYKNLAERCMNCLRQMSDNPKRTVKKSVTHFWRGFKSPRGATTPRLAAGPPSTSRGPNSRGKAGGGGARGSFRGYRGPSNPPYQRW